ncbi:MAG TPA: RNase adapter RapZ [Deltaproteobacteria bacterium]|nr:MAG: RNase adapter RapZ [Deltaproteobacteria bacterium]RLB10138.1 MAG: RNase adapter RapZ [Deltaproteobacteria bacterium]HDM77841.1 RNase adapter RapZ [Deltaproteobacteria bacterium]
MSKAKDVRENPEKFDPRDVKIVIITGLSGSGKSTVINAFEDISYFCIDNLPLPLLTNFLELHKKEMQDVNKIALGVDIRERSFFKEYPEVFRQVANQGYDLEIIFLEASIEALHRRYSQTRRKHPLASKDINLLQAINLEREELRGLRKMATKVINTTEKSVHQLKALITSYYSGVEPGSLLSIELISFGFKYGVPFEADIVMDVRFLPNPYFVEELRGLTGLDEKIKEWVLNRTLSKEFLDDFLNLILKYLPRYIEEGKRYLNIAVGCTGGRHRSVVIVEEIRRVLEQRGYKVVTYHRDIDAD